MEVKKNDIFTVKIERMKQTDIDAVCAIEEKAYGEHHWSKESFFNELSNELARYYSAFDETGKLVGYAGSWQILEETHITNVAVHPDFRQAAHLSGLQHHQHLHQAAGCALRLEPAADQVFHLWSKPD